MHLPRLLFGAVRGGSGKTLLAVGVAYLFKRRGLKVKTYKKGPDYIDAAWLSLASGAKCNNLDSYLMNESQILESFLRNSNGYDVSIIEGNRGIFDSSLDIGDSSSANLAKLLNCPVILIIDCTKMTKTAAAVVLGVMNFDKDLSVKGVILNNIGSKRQVDTIVHSIEHHTGVRVFGAIPRFNFDPFPMRHLGVTTVMETSKPDVVLGEISEIMQKSIDLNGIYEVAKDTLPIEGHIKSFSIQEDFYQDFNKDVNIGVLMDEAFQFYYPENLEALKKEGANLVFINSLRDDLPDNLHSLYIGGGFPETNAIYLSQNRIFREKLKKYIEDGLPVYAECGGLMYLGRYIEYQGKKFEMLNIIPYDFILENKPVGHGYTEILIEEDSIFYKKGEKIRGHEFHYSRPIPFSTSENNFSLNGKMIRGKGIYHNRDGILYKNVFGTYTHIHFYTHPNWGSKMINASIIYRDNLMRSRG